MMSSYGAGKCDKCEAYDDYCHLVCADGKEIDCRDLVSLDDALVLKQQRDDARAALNASGANGKDALRAALEADDE
jgi:hypothetical protein